MSRRACLIVLSLSFATQALAAADADQDRCTAYAQKAVQQYELLQAHPQCHSNIDPLAWKGDYEYHHRGCLLLPTAMSKFADQARDDHLRKCGALGSGGSSVGGGNTTSTAEDKPAPVPAPTLVPAPGAGPTAAPQAGATTASDKPTSTPPVVTDTNLATLPASYTLTDVTQASGKLFKASGLNAAGTIVGLVSVVNEGQVHSLKPHAIFYDGTLHDINSTGPVTAAYGEAINASGQVTGRTDRNLAYIYDGAIHLLPTPLAEQTGEGKGINSSGKVVGDYLSPYNPDGAHPSTLPRAFFYDGRFHDLGAPAGSVSHALSINDSDQIAGYGQISGGQLHAFIYDGKLHDLGALVHGGSSRASGIDNQGRVSGTASDANGHDRAFFYNGSLHDLGTFGGLDSRATAIASGIVVGSADARDGLIHAFASNGGTLIDLNHRLSGSHEGIRLDEAIAINASGKILAHNMQNEHYYLLTPSKDPPSEPVVACVEPSGPPQGSGAKIDRSSAGVTTLTFRSTCSGERQFVVMRPRINSQAFADAQAGSWVYAAPDKKSGIMFNVAASGAVSATALTGPALHMVMGP